MDVSPYIFYFPVSTFELTLFALILWVFIKRNKMLGWPRATLLINVLIYGNMNYFFWYAPRLSS